MVLAKPHGMGVKRPLQLRIMPFAIKKKNVTLPAKGLYV